MMSGAYSQFSKMDSDEIYAAAIQDLQEIFSLKVIYPLCVLCVCLCVVVLCYVCVVCVVLCVCFVCCVVVCVYVCLRVAMDVW